MPETSRPRSVRSVASNSSLASGKTNSTLSRRPRISNRTRSKTVTGAPMFNNQPTTNETTTPTSDLPYLTTTQPQISPGLSPVFFFPPKQIHSANSLLLDIPTSDTGSSSDQAGTVNDATATIVEPLKHHPAPIDLPKSIKLTSSLPHLDIGYRPPPSAFSRDPALTPINARDSVSTNQSGVSSSLYPPSTSTASGPDSPTSPPSMHDHFPSIDQPPFAIPPELSDLQGCDSDDVSYRLRLLVKNNYFLPPAHHKPSPADFASDNPNPPKKSTSPAFLDIFRVGKSKSKPPTPTIPTQPFDAMGGMRRTTPDAITSPFALGARQPRASAQLPRLSPGLPTTAPRGRVVVVREKMQDIAVAAKQAEHDMKTRGGRLDQGSQKPKPDPVDEVIDPTDAVDVPLPDPNYPFTVQASALHGLGVLDSVGADVLADRLPPPKNPNLSSAYDPMEDTWRKALLHEAVHHSLDNSPDISSFSQILGSSTPILASPAQRDADTPAAMLASQKAARLQKRIVPDASRGSPAVVVTSHARKASGASEASTSKGVNTTGGLSVQNSKLLDSSRPSSFLPQRVETPCGPMTPLGPPPRRNVGTHQYSLSQTELSPTTAAYPPPSPLHSASPYSTLRRTVSTPSFTEGHSSELIHPPRMSTYRDSTMTVMSYDTRKSYDSASRTTSVNYGNAGGSHASLDIGTRPSLSEYSQSSMSPTTSAFQDMLNHEDASGNFTLTVAPMAPVFVPMNLPYRASADKGRQSGSRPSTSELRYSAVSPPPRTSSQLAHIALPPPPRANVFTRPPLPTSLLSMMHAPSVQSSLRTSEQADTSAGTETFSIDEPEPVTPPVPTSSRDERERQARRTPTTSRTHPPLSLNIPTVRLPVAIHSAPGPSSPTNFFDTIQSHPNAMDDLESSSDDETEGVDEEMQQFAERQAHQHQILMDARNRSFSAANASTPSVAMGSASILGMRMGRPGIMKHHNFSTPYLGHGDVSGSSTSHSSWKASPSHQPVGNMANRKEPIANLPSGKKGSGASSSSANKEGFATNSYDFFKYAQEHPPPTFPTQEEGAAKSAFRAGLSGPRAGSAELKRPATADHVMTWRKDQKAQESLKRLDGMLLQHMEDEKEAIRRIATGLQQQQVKGRPVQGKWDSVPARAVPSTAASGPGPVTLTEGSAPAATRSVSASSSAHSQPTSGQ